MPRDLTNEQLLTAAARTIRDLDAELNAAREQLAKAAGRPAPASQQLAGHDGPIFKATQSGHGRATEGSFSKAIADHRSIHATASTDAVASSDGFARGAQAHTIEKAQVREALRKDAGGAMPTDAQVSKAIIRRMRHQGLQRGPGSGDLA
jgi:hypothetical protein